MTTPYTFQQVDVRQLYRWDGRAIVGWEQGLGKTFFAWYYAHLHPEVLPMVIVCPMSVKYNWAREGELHFGFKSTVLEGTRPPTELPKADAYVLNYDILGKRRAKKGGTLGGGWLPALRALAPSLVVLDEIQYIGNRSSARTKACRELCKGVPHVLGLSGTPLTNRPAELWPMLHILRPRQFPYFNTFGHQFCGAKMGPYGWDYSGATNLDQLHELLCNRDTGLMLRRRKMDVLDQLPEKQRSVFPVPLSHPSEYRAALKDFRGWLIRNAPGRAESAWKAVALTKLGYLKRLAAELKLPSVYNWVDDYLAGGDGKLIIFGVHQKILLPLLERYRRKAVLIDGSVTGKDRQVAVDAFNESPRCRLLVGNIRAAGTGWSARDCSTTLFAELDWTPGAHAQAEDRTHGISRGREGHASHSVYLLARGTVEEKLCELIHRKQKVLNAVLDGGEGDEFNLQEELLKYVEGEVA